MGIYVWGTGCGASELIEAGFGTEPNIEEALRLKFLALKLEQNEENPDSVEIPIE